MKLLNKSELKALAYNLIKQEFMDNNIDNYDIFPITYLEFFFLVQGSLKEKKESYLNIKGKLGIEFGSDDGRYIGIFLDRFLEEKNPYVQIYNLVFTCFHEVRHILQDRFDEKGYDRFINEISEYHKAFINYDNYEFSHDEYPFEIGADIYANTKTKKYLQSIYPDEFDKFQLMYEMEESKIRYNYLLCNYKMLMNESLNRIIQEKDFDKVSVLKYYFDENGNFKNIQQIREITEKENIDNKITYLILSSEPFIKNLDKSSLSASDKEYLKKASSYTLEILNNQAQFRKKIIEYLDYVDEEEKVNISK